MNTVQERWGKIVLHNWCKGTKQDMGKMGCMFPLQHAHKEHFFIIFSLTNGSLSEKQLAKCVPMQLGCKIKLVLIDRWTNELKCIWPSSLIMQSKHSCSRKVVLFIPKFQNCHLRWWNGTFSNPGHLLFCQNANRRDELNCVFSVSRYWTKSFDPGLKNVAGCAFIHPLNSIGTSCWCNDAPLDCNVGYTTYNLTYRSNLFCARRSFNGGRWD